MEIKTELLDTIPKERHCQLAEMAAIVSFGGPLVQPPAMEIIGENEAIKTKYFTLREKAFSIEAGDITIRSAGQTDRTFLKRTCCRRAYLRGAFICVGSMSDPQGGYHLELVVDAAKQAAWLGEILDGFDIEAKIAKRKKNYVVYLKEGASIVDLLNVIGAHKALLSLENLRVEKEVRNTINRKVNCETANIGKTVSAAARQIEDIARIKERGGFRLLPDYLRQTAELRLAYPDASLQELGELLRPPLGKSGVNHRLRKLSAMARK
jgi:DNA-binding protein WhiA